MTETDAIDLVLKIVGILESAVDEVIITDIARYEAGLDDILDAILQYANTPS